MIVGNHFSVTSNRIMLDKTVTSRKNIFSFFPLVKLKNRQQSNQKVEKNITTNRDNGFLQHDDHGKSHDCSNPFTLSIDIDTHNYINIIDKVYNVDQVSIGNGS